MPVLDRDSELAQLRKRFQDSTVTLVIEYRDLDVKALKYLHDLIGEWSHFEITRNTVARTAADQTSLWDLRPFLNGPTGLIFVNGDPKRLATALTQYTQVFPLVIRCAVIQGQVVTDGEFMSLAPKTPPPPPPPEYVVKTETPPPAPTTYDVTLIDDGGRKLAVIKAIKDVFGFDLAQARQFVESAPTLVAANASEDDAWRVAEWLQAAGATIDTRPTN